MHELWKNNLLDFGALLLQHYKKLGLNEEEYVFLCLLAHQIRQSPSSWDFNSLADTMTLDQAQCSKLFIDLMERDFLVVKQKTDDQGKRFEEYSLAPVFHRIEGILSQSKTRSQAQMREGLFKMLQLELGVLSPLEIEKVHLWIADDGFDPDVIEVAIGEMKANQISSLKYVDKILLDWKKKNIKTVEEAKRQLLEFRGRGRRQGAPVLQVPAVNPDWYYDWMEEI